MVQCSRCAASTGDHSDFKARVASMQSEYTRHSSVITPKRTVPALTCTQNVDIVAVHVLAIQDLPNALLDALIEAVGPPAVEEAPMHCRAPPWQPAEGCGRRC